MFNNRDLIPSDNGDVHENFAEIDFASFHFFFAIILMDPAT